MSQRFNDWQSAHNAAIDLANQVQLDAAIRKVKEFGKTGFNVSIFCKNDSWNAEIVKPNTPKVLR